jgi:hypothetical protein
MTPERYRQAWLKMHASYEKRAYRAFIASLRESVKVPWSEMDMGNYKMLTDINITSDQINKAYFDVYSLIGGIHGRKIGRQFDKDTKDFFPDSFTEFFRNFLIQWLNLNAGQKIVSVRSSLVQYLIAEIEKGIAQGLTIDKIATNMAKLVNSRTFYRWQAMRIARTETTAAANLGALVATDTTGVVYDKLWISANDARTRRRPVSRYDHGELHLTKVGENEDFVDNGAVLRFPADPKAPAGATINCRCSVSLVPRRGPDGRVIRKV